MAFFSSLRHNKANGGDSCTHHAPRDEFIARSVMSKHSPCHGLTSWEHFMSGRRFFLPAFTVLAMLALAGSPLHGQGKKSKKGGVIVNPIGVETLADKAKPSIVVILHTGRQGKQAG